MKIIFFLLSIAYISAIFLFAGAPMVSELAAFNPYSLLHIPLYGMLTALLIFSFVPIKLNCVNTFSHLRVNASTLKRIHTSTYVRFFIPGVISLIIAIADEIHQSFIPTRDASITDVFLDIVGILLALFLIIKFYGKKNFFKNHLAQSTN